MTGGVPIMRPYRCWTVLQVSILALLVLASNADNCEEGVNVRRNTVYEAFVGHSLTIKCPVDFCTSSEPAVSWLKIEGNNSFIPVDVSSSSHITTNWEELSSGKGILYLIFKKLVINDTGQYRCQSGNDMGHIINVSVKGDDGFTTVAVENDTTKVELTPTTDLNDILVYYVYPAAGILTFVIIVIVISIISMRGCKGKSSKGQPAENQYMEIPMLEQAFPHVSLQASPRQSPSAPPSRRPTRKQRPSSQPNGTPGDNEVLYSSVKDSRDRRRNAAEEVEEGGSVVYAALNHQQPARAPVPRPRRREEDFSEYAAIRVS